MKKVFILLFVILLCGCSSENNKNNSDESVSKTDKSTAPQTETETINMDKIDEEIIDSAELTDIDEPPLYIENNNLNEYFKGVLGSAVIYDPSSSTYLLSDSELCEKESSPCSTFKIISTIIGLHHNAIDVNNSTRKWSGTTYWKEEWNNDIDLKDAFQYSCIWYFRQVIDELGKETVQDELNRLNYGNCDISDWEGFLNTNNNSTDLRGFWVESSLKISPIGQVNVLQKIFESESLYRKEDIAVLKDAMVVSDIEASTKVYGKTGTGVKDGKNVDAWFVGMFENNGQNIYVAVRLQDPENENADSMLAKKIAITLIDDYPNLK